MAREDEVMVESIKKGESGYTNDAERAAYQPSGLSPEPVVATSNRGRLTATKTRILGTGYWLWSKTFYDKRGRVIQVQAAHQLDGKDIQTTLYRSAVNSEIKATKLYHTAKDKPAIEVVKTFDYDHAGRLLKVNHQLNGGETVTLLANEYNELGS